MTFAAIAVTDYPAGNPMRVFPVCLALLLAGCGGSASDPGPGGVTMGEAAALNDAAAMLDANSVAIDNSTGDLAIEGNSE